MIQEEKQNTELRAEELESRVGSVDHLNLLSRSGRLSPPLSGRSTPKSQAVSPQRAEALMKYQTVSSSAGVVRGPAGLTHWTWRMVAPVQRAGYEEDACGIDVRFRCAVSHFINS